MTPGNQFNNFTANITYNDFMIVLKYNIYTESVRPICLPIYNSSLPRFRFSVSGWGLTEKSKYIKRMKIKFSDSVDA